MIRDLKGLRYLERLLANPGREIHVMDLVAVERGSLPTGGAVGVVYTPDPIASLVWHP